MAADPALIALFAQGWAITRGVAAPVPRYGGYFIGVGQPDQKARYVFPSLDPAVIANLGQTIREPFVYLKICEDEHKVRKALPSHWAIRQPPTYIMTRPLDPTRPKLPPGYALTTALEGAVLRATIATEGAPVASGGIILLGDTVLFDQVGTHEAHRRRGLGRAVMTALSNAALEQGAPNGLLSATEMGRALYEDIGWSVHSPYTSAVIPGD